MHHMLLGGHWTSGFSGQLGSRISALFAQWAQGERLCTRLYIVEVYILHNIYIWYACMYVTIYIYVCINRFHSRKFEPLVVGCGHLICFHIFAMPAFNAMLSPLKQASVDWGRNTAAIVEKGSLTDPLFLEHVGHLGNRPSSTRDVRGCKKHLKVTNQSYYANLSG